VGFRLEVGTVVRAGIAFGFLVGLSAPASARESHTFGGEGGLSRSFTLIGGNYNLYVYAKSPSRSIYAGGSKSCVFGGNLQRVGGNNEGISFGNGVTVGPVIGYKLGPSPIALPPGVYRLYVASATNCMWHATIESADDNGAALAPVRLETEESDESAESVTLRDKVQFIAQYRTDHARNVPVSGRMELMHGGRVARTYPLKFGSETESLASVAYVGVQWDARDADLLGRNTARFVVTIDGHEFTSTADFTLTQ
jgi:hypothetical protein